MKKPRSTIAIAIAVLAAFPALAFLLPGGEPAPAADLLAAGPLPAPPRSGGMALVDALWARRSVRKFADRPVSREDLAFVLWAAAGVNRPDEKEKRRTAPSAWGMNAVSVYAVTKDGAALYDPLAHALRPIEAARGKDRRGEMAGAEFTRTAPVVLVLVADFSRYSGRAAPEALREMANCDAGAMAQNVYLAAAAKGLGTVVTADARPESKAALGLGDEARALYTMPLGSPADAAPAGAAR